MNKARTWQGKQVLGFKYIISTSVWDLMQEMNPNQFPILGVGNLGEVFQNFVSKVVKSNLIIQIGPILDHYNSLEEEMSKIGHNPKSKI